MNAREEYEAELDAVMATMPESMQEHMAGLRRIGKHVEFQIMVLEGAAANLRRLRLWLALLLAGNVAVACANVFL